MRRYSKRVAQKLLRLCYETISKKDNYRDKNLLKKVSPESLLWNYSNDYSQLGQDGILNEIFKRLGITKGYFVEFGAWDGITISNCRHLYEKGWQGIFIEGAKKKIQTA